ncbi:jacalin-like lectin, partial [Streptomyces sp. NPDC001500]
MRRHLACLAAVAALGGLAVAALPTAAAAAPSDTATTTSTTAPAGTAAVDSGGFNVLSYNVAGLPEIISSASTPRDTSTTAIGRRIAPYDVVHVEEDFN